MEDTPLAQGFFDLEFGDIVNGRRSASATWHLGPLTPSADSPNVGEEPPQPQGVADSPADSIKLDPADALTDDNVKSDIVATKRTFKPWIQEDWQDGASPWHGDELDSEAGGPTDCEKGLDTSAAASPDPPTRESGSLVVAIPESTLVVPRSHYEPFDPGLPIVSERTAVNKLLEAAKAMCGPDDDFLEVELNDFVIYNDKEYYGVEMRPLHQLSTKHNGSDFVFDGVLSVGDQRLFVRRVPIYALPIGNYGDLDEHTVRDSLWILSPLNQDKDLYYRLGKPAKEYARFFQPFLWVADLAKHFVDYIKSMWDNRKRVSIHDFRCNFGRWMRRVHRRAPGFLAWLAEHRGGDDFRTSIIANLPFLHKEAIGVLGEKQTYVHTLWDEVSSFQRYKPPPKELLKGEGEHPPTIVTSYIMECFQHLPFGDRLEVLPFSSRTEALRNKLIREQRLELPHNVHQDAKTLSTITKKDRIRNIQPGDTISTHRDTADSGTAWEREEAKDFADVDRWFALVQKVSISKTGRRSFDVTWYYRPVDTLCGLMKYPWNNELFLSDHCSCHEKSKITEDEILGVHEVEFHGTGTTTAELFCRQTYMHEDRKWVTLQASHLKCEHTNEYPGTTSEYRPGDTVLVHLDRRSEISEPCEVVSLIQKESGRFAFNVRRLLRRRQVDRLAQHAPPNELVYPSGESALVTVSENAILERCHVRFFKHNQPIPTPYDRNGVGCLFFITHGQGQGDQGIVPLDEFPTSLKQGLNPGDDVPKLRGLDLFCGGGNFGRGLEDGGGIKMQWANDYDCKAIHTYMANIDPKEDIHPFLGSIDILQRLAIEGRFSKSVPKIGEVDFISAGSPCPGFSRLTNDKTTVKQRKNQSLVAAFASFIDLYRPKYGLLENVPGILQNKAGRREDVFSQLMCAIVGLGYQAQFFFRDASSCGAPQRRSRVFVVLAAPGYELPQQPPQTHSHPPRTPPMGVGKLPTGESMARRRIPVATPFKFVTGAEATADLPPLLDGKPDICVSHPDHRVALGMTKKIRRAMYHIPTRPYGMNFAKAYYGEKMIKGAGVLTEAEREFFPAEKEKGRVSRVAPNSQAYGRQDPTRLIETIVTMLSPHDAKAGRQIHWWEDRIISVMEARRAQGFRDNEVVLGNPNDQVKIVGNSVAREISLALGIVFREAWVATLRRDGSSGAAATVRAKEAESTTAEDSDAQLGPIVIDDSADSSDDDFASSAGRVSTSMTPIPSSGSPPSHQDPPPVNKTSGKRHLQSTAEDSRPAKAPRPSPDAGEETISATVTTTLTTTISTTIQARRSVGLKPSRLGKEVIVPDDSDEE
ncbi:DNA-like protein [Hapsidospora chrysogenum ATCC 11550]|uniref:DNA (cytosine-5-)-methyltransferase n=1 Tax=Hapsidospora chrysogenum (strain ATCC 11550 / CBS 779.69 / DSM 880 / IAM 14645 / JCM 23072 / IMI 49137) TaxID=857340 RepID=A0A086TFV5_HAPC1|nr:DNA-like protein [Hapsidospora chrysogenum ATCC 11550]